MSINLRALAKALDGSDKIVTPAVYEWLLLHSDDPLSKEVADRIYALLTTPPRVRSGSFSASSAGMCPRAQVFQYLGMPGETVDAQLANIFMDGKWRHLRWQAVMLSAGIAIDVEFPLPWPAMRSVGTMDALGVVPDTHPNTLWREQEFGFELKGVSTFQFGKYKSDGPKDEHLDQVAAYFLSSGLTLFVILYEDKTTQSLHEWVVTAENPDMKKRMAKRMEELWELNKAVDNKRLPPHLAECKKLKGVHYMSCGVPTSITKWPVGLSQNGSKGNAP